MLKERMALRTPVVQARYDGHNLTNPSSVPS
jgi:hypothetical protein